MAGNGMGLNARPAFIGHIPLPTFNPIYGWRESYENKTMDKKFYIPAPIANRTDINFSDKAVLTVLVIFRRGSLDSEIKNTSKRRVADFIHINKSSVSRSIDKLRALNLIHEDERGPDRPNAEKIFEENDSEGKGIYIYSDIMDLPLTLNQRFILSLVTAPSWKDGSCYASNAWIGDILGLSKRTISSTVTTLKELGYINVDIKGRSTAGSMRYITRVDDFKNPQPIPEPNRKTKAITAPEKTPEPEPVETPGEPMMEPPREERRMRKAEVKPVQGVETPEVFNTEETMRKDVLVENLVPTIVIDEALDRVMVGPTITYEGREWTALEVLELGDRAVKNHRSNEERRDRGIWTHLDIEFMNRYGDFYYEVEQEFIKGQAGEA